MIGMRFFNRHKLRNLLLGSVLVLLSACSEQELFSSLSEQQANDMVALMYGANMPATKKRGNDGNFSVLTDKDYFAAAVNLLRAHGLPRERYDSLGDVFAKEGFVSSPLEERARLNHAMTQEISHTISNIDGVIMARVHLAVPEPNELSDVVHEASASVFIKHRADVDLTVSVANIKAMVVNGIENLPYEQVTVALFPAAPPDTAKFTATPERSGPVKLQFLPNSFNNSILFVIVGVLILLGVLFPRLRSAVSETGAREKASDFKAVIAKVKSSDDT